MTIENTLWLAGVGAELSALAVVLYRRAYRTFPVFCIYLAWGLISDVGEFYASLHVSSTSNLLIYVVALAVDSLFQFGVLLEVSRSVLRPMAKLLPRWTPAAVGVLIILICAAIWPFAKSPGFSGFSIEGRLLVHLQQTFSILRILFFLALAGCSQLLSIGWRDRELQIATGLGFYSMVSIAVAILHTHQAAGPQYHLLDQIMASSYLCSLLYWVYCFAQQEATRREFTPQMQNFLLAVAGTARSTRMALAETAPAKNRDRRQ